MFRKKKTPEPRLENVRPIDPETQGEDNSGLGLGMRFEHNEKRDWVRRIRKISYCDDGNLELIADNLEAPVLLERNKIDVDVRASNIRYDAGYAADRDCRFEGFDDGKSLYYSMITADLEFVGSAFHAPLLWMPSRDIGEDHGLVTACVVDDVRVQGFSVQANIGESPETRIALWKDYEKFEEYQSDLFERYRQHLKSGQVFDKLFPNVVLDNGHSKLIGRKRSRSHVSIPVNVFESLKSDIFAIGPKVNCTFRMCIEAFVSKHGTNYGWPEYDDHRFSYEWAIIPGSSVLTAELLDIVVSWRRAKDYFDRDTDEHIVAAGAAPLDLES